MVRAGLSLVMLVVSGCCTPRTVPDTASLRVAPGEACPSAAAAEPRLRATDTFDAVKGGPMTRTEVPATIECCYRTRLANNTEEARCYSIDVDAGTCAPAGEAAPRINTSGGAEILDGPASRSIDAYSVCTYDVTKKTSSDVCG